MTSTGRSRHRRKSSCRAARIDNPVDALVHAKLKQLGLGAFAGGGTECLVSTTLSRCHRPAPVAARAEGFRARGFRATLEKLLASERYGEKWARHWMDVARYSDTNGYEKDLKRDQWIWRDWVIHALNEDLPYDQFLIEQIAGDLLPDATQDQVIATGFLRNSMINEEGAIIPEQFRMVEMFDRDGLHRQGCPRTDDPMRPVPQPQVRSDHDGRVLWHVRLSQQQLRSTVVGLHAMTSSQRSSR